MSLMPSQGSLEAEEEAEENQRDGSRALGCWPWRPGKKVSAHKRGLLLEATNGKQKRKHTPANTLMLASETRVGLLNSRTVRE